jgi:hypothetical protein
MARRKNCSIFQSLSSNRRKYLIVLCSLSKYFVQYVIHKILAFLTHFCSTHFVLGILERRRNRPEAVEASFIEAQNLWFRGFRRGCIRLMRGAYRRRGWRVLMREGGGGCVCDREEARELRDKT